jgi:hypothetical protein
VESIRAEGSHDAVDDIVERSSSMVLDEEASVVNRQPSAFTTVTSAGSGNGLSSTVHTGASLSHSSEVCTNTSVVSSSSSRLTDDTVIRPEGSVAAVEIPDDNESPPPYEVALRMRVMPPSLNPSAVFRHEYHFRPIVDDTSSISTVSTYLSADLGDQQLTPRHRATAGGTLGWKFSPFRQSPAAVLAAAFTGVSSVASSSRRNSSSTRTGGLIPLQTYHVETSL